MTQETDNPQITPPAFQFSTGSAFSALKDSFTGPFWSKAQNLLWQNKKHFIKPALLLLLGPFVIMGGFYFGSLGMGEGVQNFVNVVFQLLICWTIGGLGGTVLIVWSIADWLIKLTAYCRSYINGESMQESLDYLKTRKGFLFIAWFVYMVLMTPFIIFLLLSGLVSMMQYLPQPLYLPEFVDTIINALTAVGLIFTTMYAVILIPVTAVHTGKGSSAAFGAFVGTMKTFPIIFIYSILANIIYCVTMETVLIVVLFRVVTQAYVPMLSEQVMLIFASAILRGVASFIVLPLLIALPAEITKRAIKN